MLWKGFQRPKRLEFERETLTDRFGRFYAQPFERGFGTTIGNALRRVLLSSIEGAAITAVKIDGVLHEFSPIPGVVEDATDIILNLKQIPLKMHTDATKTLYLRVDKADEVRARDIEADGDIEILEPDAHIATVAVQTQRNLLQVQNDVGGVFHHARDRRKLMQHAFNLHRGYRRPFDRGQQHATHGVADRGAESPFERLRVETPEPLRQCFPLELQPLGPLKTFPQHCRCPFADGPADGPPDLQGTADLPPQVCVRLRADGCEP